MKSYNDYEPSPQKQYDVLPQSPPRQRSPEKRVQERSPERSRPPGSPEKRFNRGMSPEKPVRERSPDKAKPSDRSWQSSDRINPLDKPRTPEWLKHKERLSDDAEVSGTPLVILFVTP